jgi:hypothetical protein
MNTAVAALEFNSAVRMNVIRFPPRRGFSQERKCINARIS